MIKLKLQSFIRTMLGLFFLFSAIAKISDYQVFINIITAYAIFPENMVGILAITIPSIEVILGLMLLTRLKIQMASLGLIIMLIVFTAISTIRYLHGDVSECGCFGKLLERQNDMTLVVENGLLLTGLVFIRKKYHA